MTFQPALNSSPDRYSPGDVSTYTHRLIAIVLMTFQPTLNSSPDRYSPGDVSTYTQLLLCSPSFQEVSTYAKLIA